MAEPRPPGAGPRCAACGREFPPSTAGQRYCSRLCRQRVYQRQRRAQAQQARHDELPSEKPDD